MWNEIIGEINLGDFVNEGMKKVEINIEDLEEESEKPLKDEQKERA